MAEVRELLADLARRWREDRITGLAAEVAFFGVLALFPALLALASALGFLEGLVGSDLAERTRSGVVDGLNGILTEDASGTVDAVDALFREPSPGLLTIGLLSAMWAASRGFAAVIRALDVVYDLAEHRSYAAIRGLALLLAAGTLAVVAVVLTMVVVGPLLGTGQQVADALGGGEAFALVWDWVRWPVVMVVLLAWLATLFHVAPNHRTPWHAELPGAVVATLLWVLLSVGLRAYLAIAPEANQVMGVLGGAITVLIWLYLLALGLLVGGEVNAALAARYGDWRKPTTRVDSS